MRQTRMSDEELLYIRYYLHLARPLEDRLSILYREGKIAGGVYLSTRQEAVSVGGAASLGTRDVIVPSHCDMGAHLLRGIAPREAIAQFLGRVGGPMRGRGQRAACISPRVEHHRAPGTERRVEQRGAGEAWLFAGRPDARPRTGR